ncbi:hypothetical protein JD844_034114 [Phrynosoma platyrhinos]|uniref:Peptidase S1 domain-containing protein n=1 Tax=Phrynosoma platyrhinos TaxID=52577 RepID=A0ABQ7T7W9_PHRPL|nr:hypothetical protein JD844_034114 [Phrynosoma platyrhinos]
MIHTMDISVILGAHDLNAIENTTQVLGVEKYYMHPGYQIVYDTPFHDILLLKLEREAQLNENVQIIPLPKTDNDLPKDTHCFVAGWGRIDERYMTSSKLFETNVTIPGRRKCLLFLPELTDDMLCAGSRSVMCDVSNSQIIGGHEAKPHSRPYIAALKTGDDFGCGGDITVVLGAHNLQVPEESQQVIGVQSYHMHPEYNPKSFANDILLLKLDFKPILNKYVQIISLPKTQSDLPAGTPCSIAGWGLIDKDKTTPRLFETNVNIYNRRKCRMVYTWLDDGMICAGSHKQLLDTSQGDSGGPMVCNGVVQGIVSFGYNAPPGVYSRIAYYLPWIRKVMESNP